MPTVADITAALDEFAPPSLAADWDNTGLLLGDASAKVERILTCLTVTDAVAAEAIELDADLVVTHHPILFRGSKRLTAATAEGRVVTALAAHGVAVFSPHTAFDNCNGGINDQLAAKLRLTDVCPLRPAKADALKLVVFVPDADLAKVSDAAFAAGAGVIGKYRECGFRLAGTGTFFGTDGANPAVGQVGRREDVSEWRLEVVCPRPALAAVLAAVRHAHSYEEPAFDVYPLHATAGTLGGEGRVGRLAESVSLGEFAGRTGAELGGSPVQVVGELGREITTAAVACGAAGEFLRDAVRVGADVFVTGEMRFHDLLEAEASGIAVVLPGHYATERCGVEMLAAMLAERWPGVASTASERERDPVAWV